MIVRMFHMFKHVQAPFCTTKCSNIAHFYPKWAPLFGLILCLNCATHGIWRGVFSWAPAGAWHATAHARWWCFANAWQNVPLLWMVHRMCWWGETWGCRRREEKSCGWGSKTGRWRSSISLWQEMPVSADAHCTLAFQYQIWEASNCRCLTFYLEDVWNLETSGVQKCRLQCSSSGLQQTVLEGGARTALLATCPSGHCALAERHLSWASK